MIRLLVITMLMLLALAGCRSPQSASQISQFLPASGTTVSPSLSVPAADVLVVFADADLGGGSTELCPIAAITTDTECAGFSTGGLDTVCRWAKDTVGKPANQKKVQWKSVNASGGPPASFQIVFRGGASPCNPPTANASVVTCTGKTAAGLGFAAGDPSDKELAFKYNVVVANCPVLDPRIIWRR
jgi:hypothetical protein